MPVFLLTVVISLVSWYGYQPLAHAGNEGAHAGDYVASEFQVQGQHLMAFLTQNAQNAQILGPSTLAAIDRAVRDTPVNSVDEILYDPRSHDAVDALTVDDPASPSGKSIRLQRQRWEKLFASKAKLHRLVIHEYLWAAGEDDLNYRISGRLFLPDDLGDDTINPLAGTTWMASSTNRGITSTRYVSFDHHGTYRYIETLQDSTPYGLRAVQIYGSFTMQDGKVTRQILGGSCPLANESLGRTKGVYRFENNVLILDSEVSTTPLFFTRTNNDIISTLGSPKWGCIAINRTFTSYAGSEATDAPVPAIPNDLPAANAGDKFQAIAYSFLTRSYGASADQTSAAAAWMSATAACRQADCAVITWSRNTCVAQSVSSRTRRGWGEYHANRATAEENSLNLCRKNIDDSCQLAASICPTPSSSNPPPSNPAPVTRDLSPPLTVQSTASIIRYNVYWTDQDGDKGTFNFMNTIENRNYRLNPNRLATFYLTGSTITFCYDRRLAKRIRVSATGLIQYCFL